MLSIQDAGDPAHNCRRDPRGSRRRGELSSINAGKAYADVERPEERLPTIEEEEERPNLFGGYYGDY